MNLPLIPALRYGQPYESLDRTTLCDHRTGEPLAWVSQINAGVVRKDLRRTEAARQVLRQRPVREWIAVCAEAGRRFMEDTLPLGVNGHTQSPEQYLTALSRTSGLTHGMVRRNMEKIRDALVRMETVLNGLTRGLDLSILDRGYGEQHGARLSFYPTAKALGLIMPSNSPAVNSLWLPAIPLKTPVIIKPGREEPWTPYRLIQAFLAAGCPPEAFGFYPTDHEGAADILRNCGRALLFGDTATTAPYANNPGVQIHGPGFSKILVGDDAIEDWPELIDLMAASISENGGRSCVNASAVVVPKYGREIAEALAARLGPVEPAPPEAEGARLSGFANPKMAEFIDRAIEEDLKAPGAEEVTARHRSGPRRVSYQGGIYLRPTIVRCDSFDHPLANREFLFPYASVVEMAQKEMLAVVGPSLVVTAVTRDEAFTGQLLESPLIERLNLGRVPTIRVSWDQPHEGNMFEFLYKRRSLERG